MGEIGQGAERGKGVDEGKSPIHKEYFDRKRREDSRLSQSLGRTPLEPEEDSHLVALDPRFLKLEAENKRKDREIKELTLENRELKRRRSKGQYQISG